jgi:hypothetical protein
VLFLFFFLEFVEGRSRPEPRDTHTREPKPEATQADPTRNKKTRDNTRTRPETKIARNAAEAKAEKGNFFFFFCVLMRGFIDASRIDVESSRSSETTTEVRIGVD